MNTKKSIEPDVSGLYWEGRVCAAWGLERKLVAKLRKEHLTEGADFVRRENNAVALTAQGLRRIDELVSGGTVEGGAEKNRFSAGLPAGKPVPDAPAGPAPRAKMRVVRVPQHPGLLLCEGLEPPRQLAVRVRTNENFVAGMEIVGISSQDGVWQFCNRPHGDESTVGRLPRGKGRW